MGILAEDAGGAARRVGGGLAMGADLPDGVVAVRCWRHAGIDCVVGDVQGSLAGLARIGERRSGWSRIAPERWGASERGGPLGELGQWVLLQPSPARRYWSVEVLARFVSPGTPELAAWADSGDVWAIERLHRDVEDFVDAVLREAPPLQGKP